MQLRNVGRNTPGSLHKHTTQDFRLNVDLRNPFNFYVRFSSSESRILCTTVTRIRATVNLVAQPNIQPTHMHSNRVTIPL